MLAEISQSTCLRCQVQRPIRTMVTAASAICLVVYVSLSSLILRLISWTNRLVNKLAVQCLNESVFVFLVIRVVIADEYLVPGNLVRGQVCLPVSGVSDGIISSHVNNIVAATNK